MFEAMYYEVIKENIIRCFLCPNYCEIKDGDYGQCRSRRNDSGKLIAVNYGKTVAINIDPIEKKPLYHYFPGSKILSLGPNSCNLHCNFCQNYEISQNYCPTKSLYPIELLDFMQKNNLHQVAFTYTEPLTWYEYILDCCKLMKGNNIRVILVTNGYINPVPFKELLPYIDAMNVDLKSISDDFYISVCGGKLDPIRETINTAFSHCHIEITNLIIPNLNDKDQEIKDLVEFLYSLNPNIPLHFSRYFPNWKVKEPATKEKILLKAFEIASEMLNYVYVGNLPSGIYSNTYCPTCKKLLIDRSDFSNLQLHLVGNNCKNCGTNIYGKF